MLRHLKIKILACKNISDIREIYYDCTWALTDRNSPAGSLCDQKTLLLHEM